MRTTLNIPDDLYQAVKVEAARRGETVTSMVEQAMRAILSDPAHVESVPAAFPVSDRSGGMRPGIDISDSDQLFALLYEDMDGLGGRGVA